MSRASYPRVGRTRPCGAPAFQRAEPNAPLTDPPGVLFRSAFLNLDVEQAGNPRDQTGWKPVLLHNSQREVIPITALVIGLEIIAADRDDRSVGKVGKDTRDRVCRGIVN